jgi:hypothetical protein
MAEIVGWAQPSEEDAVSIFVTFGPVDMTRDEYWRVGERLPDPPEGRDYHVCSGEDGALYIAEVWDSQDAMNRHGERLGPVLQDIFGDKGFTDAEPNGYAEREVVGIHRPGELAKTA